MFCHQSFQKKIMFMNFRIIINYQQTQMNPQHPQLPLSSSLQEPIQNSPYDKIEDPDFDGEIIQLETEKYEIIDLLPNQHYQLENPYIIEDIQSKNDTELLLTNYRIIIRGKQNKSIPYNYIHSVNTHEKILQIHLKTGIHIDIVSPLHKKQIQTSIKDHMSILPFCLNTISKNQMSKIYDSWAEIDRMGVDWNLYSIAKNTNGSICPSYPCHFLIPKNYSSDTLQEIKKCRFEGKIPVMSFYYQMTGAGIWRAAKTRPNLKKQRQIYDISYLKSISGDLVTFDLEQNPLNLNKYSFNSIINLKTKFYTFTNRYSKILSSPIPPKADIFLKSLSQWFQQINKLLSLAYHIVFLLKKGRHILLEEQNGSDRVAQVTALCQIIIDPFYRSFKGFSVLVQKQFVGFNHQFEARNGFNKNKNQDTAPFFIQFLECVHQLIVTHPQSFQYSSSYLARIGYELYTAKYRNFLSFPENDQNNEKVKYCRRNIWDQVNRQLCHQNYHLNPKMLEKSLDEIRKKPSLKQYSIWVNYYDMICRMNGEKKKKLHQLRQSKRLSNFLLKKV